MKKKLLSINVDGQEAMVRYGRKHTIARLDKMPLLRVISRVAQAPFMISAIDVRLKGATFSGVRQVASTVNTIAWVRRIKVNGKARMSARYSGKPNITL